MNREVLHRLDLLPDSSPTLLDIGCGCGATMIHLSSFLPSAKWHGVTLSEKQIEMGKKMADETGLSESIQFHDADFQTLPFPEKFANGAILLESACYAEGADKGKLIEELARVLKTNSPIVIVDGFRRNSKPLPYFLEKIYQRNMQHWHLTELADIRSFSEKIKSEGFRDIEAEDISWRVFPSALHIPFKVLSLYFIKSTPAKRKYARALLHTLFMGLFKNYFGYFIVTARR